MSDPHNTPAGGTQNWDQALHADDAWHSHSGEAPPQEAHGTVHPGLLFAVGGGSFVLLLASIMFLVLMFKHGAQEELRVKLEIDLGAEYVGVKAAWEQSLRDYGWANAEEGIVHVPIENAMRQVATEYADGQ